MGRRGEGGERGKMGERKRLHVAGGLLFTKTFLFYLPDDTVVWRLTCFFLPFLTCFFYLSFFRHGQRELCIALLHRNRMGGNLFPHHEITFVLFLRY